MSAGSTVMTTAALIRDGTLVIGDGYRAKNSELSDRGIPFARAGNIDGGLDFSGADRFPVEALARVGEKTSRPGDSVFTSKGTVGRFAYVRDVDPRFVYSPQLSYWRSLRPDRLDPRYLHYWLKGHEFWLQAAGVKGQTDMADYVSLADQRRMRITVPEISVQRAIGRVLAALDDKIDLNREMNRTLEAMARAIFRSWFVDFDPVVARSKGREPFGMDAETAEFFPDRFVESELGPIPEGWEVKPIPAAFEVNPRRTLPKGVEAPYLGMSQMPERGAVPSEWALRTVGSGAKFTNGDTLLARITPCLENGKTAFVNFLERGEVGWGSTEYVVFRPRPPLPPAFAYFLSRSQGLRTFAVSNLTGSSGRQRVPTSAWEHFSFPWPPAEVAARFGGIADRCLDLILANTRESQTLAALRDLLLPKLLSGEIRVPEAAEMVGDVA